ncbi:hypothetical protein CAPTEDRAFT_187164 [Capitella teleta]|uniref:TonB C-terminal domain-containing protein n=1 Tax=Capitella teleta TaxID=283909 RepID=R7UWK4_CAPTE|nr:hypothetical protein CAPTEDRAFT_187164 [Capitella teleta]|eukprot:ELU10652.1 hypothetical protein CAPTEDRAFT_187164 [Capitella teleta]
MGQRQAMIQKFIPDIKSGDKRILMIDGEPVPYCLARIPAAGELRGNLAAGGTGEGRPLSERDLWIANQVGPVLREKGLIFVGLDVIGDYLTEINVTSPTCIRELDNQFKLDIAGQLMDKVEEKLKCFTKESSNQKAMTQPATIPSAAVSTTDRLGFTLFMAAALHVLIVLGVTFSFKDKPAPPPTLEVTLATYQSKEKPEEADYLAQINQQGSGTLEEKALPSSDQQAQFQEDTIKEVQPQSQTAAQPEQTLKQQTRITTQARSDQEVAATDDSEKQEPIAVEKDRPRKHIDLKNEIASLEAQFHQQRQEYAKRPRIKRLTAASTLQEAGAFYKESWRRKVEKVGNLNYPERARKDQLYGELRLMVAINRDGTLSNVEILDSSGYQVLDDAAVRIVKMASPFAPFDDTLKSYDMVEIIRTWRFESGDRLFSQ